MNMSTSVFFAALGLLCTGSWARVEGTCGQGSPSKVSDCQNNDCGSCGNACCRLSFTVEESTEEAVKLLNESMAKGGPDGYYSRQKTAEGPIGFGDLRPYKKPIDFIGQVHHLTDGPGNYTDLITFTIAKSGQGSLIEAFSLSLIAGAYCDAGQNYKNIVMAMKGVSWKSPFSQSEKDGSCPAPKEIFA
eukprot:TRINITY_DN112573_c0_g1_i1.p1 TRINITY_DN112573_c0_g1~~TRINITY_DN112573_c0_g1_i1.p1  ORF type:complete len:189 (-),score=35.35 TRINITY_DN112573_c0_g1_i1:89-655(-)